MRKDSLSVDEKTDNVFTSRELQTLKLIMLGKNNQEIAQELSISVYTAKSDVTSIIKKMSVSNRLQAAVKAVRQNIF